MNRTAFIHLCILMSLLLVVRCNDDYVEDEDDDDASDNNNYANYGDFEAPVKAYASDPKIISRNVKCLVCEATISEMKIAIKKIDPRKKVEVSGRMDSDGFSKVKSVQYSRSETYLTELMETTCKKMEDYAKARDKITRKLLILKMITDDGGMNPLMSSVDFVQDGDLNKSLEHFCLEILEDHEEAILKEFMKEVQEDNIDHIVCTKTAKYCDEEADDDDNYDRDEL